jgi:hypothetical protein
MAVGIEYLSNLGSVVPTGARTATAFQEGQKTAADIAMTQLQQGAYEQARQFAAMEQPYRMAGLELAQQQAAEKWRRDQEQYGRTQEALGMPLVTPGMRMTTPATGAGLRPTAPGLQQPGFTATGAPESLVQTESGGRPDLINKWGYAGRLQFGPERLADAAAAGIIPAGVTAQQFASNPELQNRVEAWHFNDINNFIQREGLGKYVGQTIDGAVVTPQGMLAVAHLGGKGGLKQFLETGGKYNPADQLGTSLASYMSRHGGVMAPSPVPSMANVPMPGQGYGTPTTLGAIGAPEFGAAPIFEGLPVSTGGVPMTGGAPAESATGMGSAWDDYAKYLLGRGLVAAGYGGSSEAASAPSAAPTSPLPTQPLLQSPLPATQVPIALTTAPAPAAPSASIFTPPGVQTGAPAAVGEANTFELLEPVRVAQSMDNARRKAEYLKSSYRRAQLTGDVGAMDKIQAETAAFGTEVELLGRMDALTRFNAGDVAPMAGILNQMTRGRMSIEPRTDGRFNVYDGKRKTAEGLTRDELSTQFRMAFDQDFQKRVEAQRQAQIAYQQEVAKAGLDIYKETKKQSVQQIRELTNKLAELQFKRDNPKVKLEKTGDGAGFIEYDEAGNIRSYLTTEPEIGIDGKPVLINPADPKSGPRYRVIRTPYTGAVPTQ